MVRDLVIRSADARTRVAVSLPCGTVKGCWPASPAWTRDSRKFSFALRDPDHLADLDARTVSWFDRYLK